MRYRALIKFKDRGDKPMSNRKIKRILNRMCIAYARLLIENNLDPAEYEMSYTMAYMNDDFIRNLNSIIIELNPKTDVVK